MFSFLPRKANLIFLLACASLSLAMDQQAQSGNPGRMIDSPALFAEIVKNMKEDRSSQLYMRIGGAALCAAAPICCVAGMHYWPAVTSCTAQTAAAHGAPTCIQNSCNYLVHANKIRMCVVGNLSLDCACGGRRLLSLGTDYGAASELAGIVCPECLAAILADENAGEILNADILEAITEAVNSHKTGPACPAHRPHME